MTRMIPVNDQIIQIERKRIKRKKAKNMNQVDILGVEAEAEAGSIIIKKKNIENIEISKN